ncbi:iron-sulfur cluster assembly protein [Streptomyces stramineus]
MVTLADLGVIRSVETAADGVMEVSITPTFLGCPAMPAIEKGIRAALADCGHPDGRVRQVISPPGPPTGSATRAAASCPSTASCPRAPRAPRCPSGSGSACPAPTAAPWRPGRRARSGPPGASPSWCAPRAMRPSRT